MLVLIFTDLDIFLRVDKNLLEFLLVIGFAIRIVIGTEFFVVKATNRCAARDSAGVEADDVVAIEDGGAEDVFGRICVIDSRSAGATGINDEAA